MNKQINIYSHNQIDFECNVKGVIDDDSVNFLHFEIYDVKVEQSKKKIVGILEQFWNDARMVPIRLRNSLELIDIAFKKPKNAQIEVNELKNNTWSILIYRINILYQNDTQKRAQM